MKTRQDLQKAYLDWAGEYLWHGKNKNKGIGIFPRKGSRVRALNWFGTFSISGLSTSSQSTSWKTEELELFLPFKINDTLNVLACWTKGSGSQVFGYIGQLWKYLQIHRSELSGPKTIIAGDLNSNSIWDKPDRWWSHTDTFNELGAIGMKSLYHLNTSEKPGSETQPTFYLHRKESKPYHIDYVLLSPDLIAGSALSIGAVDMWLSFSDHMPVSFSVSS